jgi:hypothetical protein
MLNLVVRKVIAGLWYFFEEYVHSTVGTEGEEK